MERPSMPGAWTGEEGQSHLGRSPGGEGGSATLETRGLISGQLDDTLGRGEGCNCGPAIVSYSLDPTSAANSLSDLGSGFCTLSLSFPTSEGGQLLSATHLMGS